MKSKLANKIVLCVEVVLTLFIVGIIVNNSLENVRQEVKQYQSGLQADYNRLLSAYTTDFKMMINEITPQIEKNLSFDDMQAFMLSKEADYEAAIGADVYDGISFTYKGGYVHSWNYGDYSDYDPNTRPWYLTAQEANGEIAVTAPYVTYLNESELPNTDDYIVLTLTQKYNDEISFCYDIKTFAVSELLSSRYNRYPGTFAMMYDDSGYILSCTIKNLYCHNVYQPDDIITDEFVNAVKTNELQKDKVDVTWTENQLKFIYCVTDSAGNYYTVIIPFWEVMQQAFLGIFLIAFFLIALEIWIYIRNNKQREIELQMERVAYISQMKQDFLARMSHDMRTPMNGILGMTELSAEENDVDVLKANMVKIHTAGEYLLGLINDTLDLQKMESGKFVLNPTVVSTSQLIRNSVDMVKLSAEEKNVQFVVINKNANVDSYIKIDAMRLQQIFINLLSNAFKFTPPGGKVELSLEVLGRDGNIVHDRLTIADTGTGMSEDFIKNRLFSPFSQEHNELTNVTPGTGLGLSIVKKLVDLMGASISVKSELGKGTTITIDIDFECVDAPVASTEATAMQKENCDRKVLEGKQILLAEDHPLNAEIATKILQKVGCVVTRAQNGKECVDLFEHSSPGDYDIILMDIRMPEMDGLEATAKIRALHRFDAVNIPIIAMSANAYEEDVAKSIQAGMNDHLSKPIQINSLYDTLCKYCSR